MKRPTITLDIARKQHPSTIMGTLACYVDYLESQMSLDQVLDASARCPLCGSEGPHPHTPLEQAIYRNGLKSGRSLAMAANRAPRCWFGGNYGRCELEEGHDGRHKITPASESEL